MLFLIGFVRDEFFIFWAAPFSDKSDGMAGWEDRTNRTDGTDERSIKEAHKLEIGMTAERARRSGIRSRSKDGSNPLWGWEDNFQGYPRYPR